MATRLPIVINDASGERFDVAAAQCITDPQWAWLAIQSIKLERSVKDLLLTMRPMLVLNEDGSAASLEGLLPHCSLYGAIAADGSAHT